MIRAVLRPTARPERVSAIRSFGPLVLSYPLMVAIQEISARIGRTTGHRQAISGGQYGVE
jgi:hypothetical protein